MVKIFSFSTVDKSIKILLQNKDQILYEKTLEKENRHSELLLPAIEKVLKKFDLEYSDIDAFSVIKGPGSFTGLRTGLSVAKTISFSLKKPIITVDLFELGFFAEEKIKDLFIVLKANLNNFYIKKSGKTKPIVLKFQDLLDYLSKSKNCIVVTDNDKLLKNKQLTNCVFKKFSFDFNQWASLIYEKYEKVKFDKKINPLYISPPRITKRRK